MSEHQAPRRPEAVEPSGVDHSSDYGGGARRSQLTEVHAEESATAGLAPERKSGFDAAEGREGPATVGGGH